MKMTLEEVKLVEGVMTPSWASQEGDRRYLPPATPDEELLAKIGGLLVEGYLRGVKGGNEPLEVVFSDRELVVLRERVDVRARSSTDGELGLKLKVKIYQAMLGMEGVEDSREWKHSLFEWQEKLRGAEGRDSDTSEGEAVSGAGNAAGEEN